MAYSRRKLPNRRRLALLKLALRTGDIKVGDFLSPMGHSPMNVNTRISARKGGRRLAKMDRDIAMSETTPSAKKIRLSSAPRMLQGFGDPITAMAAIKRWETNTTTGTSGHPTRELIVKNLLNVERNATTDNNIGKRNRDIINVKGVKIMMQYHNLLAKPLLLRFAIVSRKDANSDPVPEAFFRGHGSTRYADFGLGLSSLDFYGRVINSDVYTVHLEWKDKIDHNPAAVGGSFYQPTNKGNYSITEKYIAVNRQFVYKNQSDVTPENGNLYLVIWADEAAAQTNSAKIAGAFNFGTRTVVYYSEPR